MRVAVGILWVLHTTFFEMRRWSTKSYIKHVIKNRKTKKKDTIQCGIKININFSTLDCFDTKRKCKNIVCTFIPFCLEQCTILLWKLHKTAATRFDKLCTFGKKNLIFPQTLIIFKKSNAQVPRFRVKIGLVMNRFEMLAIYVLTVLFLHFFAVNVRLKSWYNKKL